MMCTSEVFRINKDGGHSYGYAIWEGINKFIESSNSLLIKTIGDAVMIRLDNLYEAVELAMVLLELLEKKLMPWLEFEETVAFDIVLLMALDR